MRFVRIQADGAAQWGVLEDGFVRLIDHAAYEHWSYTGAEISECKAKLLAPCEPSKIVCVGKNYYDHAMEMAEGIPATPILFLKPNTTMNHPEGEIEYPKSSHRVDYEGELALVISRKAKLVKAKDAMNYIFGCTCLNDVTARDIQKGDGQWTRGKSYDGFAPVGPYLVTDLDCTDLKIETRVNGVIRQSSRTSMFMWKIPELIEFITECMTLNPGDIISTGTPAGIGGMDIGDTVEVEIEGIGVLRNTIVKRKGE